MKKSLPTVDFSAIKENDCVIVGMYTKHRNEIAENAALVRKYSSLSSRIW